MKLPQKIDKEIFGMTDEEFHDKYWEYKDTPKYENILNEWLVAGKKRDLAISLMMVYFFYLTIPLKMYVEWKER